MRSIAYRGSIQSAIFVGFFAVLSAPAQPAPTDPWAQVPPLPTGCYSSEDDFSASVEAAKSVVADEHSRQGEVNSEIDQQLSMGSEEDAMEFARKMQEKMMADPQNAMKYMQEMQSRGQQAQAEQPVATDRELQMQADEKALIKQYGAALADAYGPGNARWTALKKKMGIAPDSLGPGEAGVPEWAWQEWFVIQREWDGADRATCATYFAANGQMHAFMQQYKNYLLTEQIPHHEKFFDAPKLANYEMMDVSAGGYGSTAVYEAVEDYLDLASRLFSQRKYTPRCTTERCSY